MVDPHHYTLAIFAIFRAASAHGYLGAIEANGINYTAWSPFVDRFIDPQPVRANRPFRDNGPVDDFTTPAITCNNYPNVGAGGGAPAKGNDGTFVESIPVRAGEILRLIWDSWDIPHPGPVMTYLANCNGDCKTFKGDTGNVWVKIDQMGFDKSKDPQWASLLLTKQNATWTVTVPPALAPGEYVLRHEILGLQSARTRMGAQFYPSCAHLSVSGDGTQQLPSGIALPGAYDPDDTKGIRLLVWDVESGAMEYIPPGGDVWSGAAPQVNGL